MVNLVGFFWYTRVNLKLHSNAVSLYKKCNFFLENAKFWHTFQLKNASGCSFTILELVTLLKVSIPHGFFVKCFKLYKWYQITQSITYSWDTVNPRMALDHTRLTIVFVPWNYIVFTHHYHLSNFSERKTRKRCKISIVLSFLSLLKEMNLKGSSPGFAFNPSRFNPGRREKIKSNFYFHTSLWCLKRFYEGLKGLLRHHKEVRK